MSAAAIGRLTPSVNAAMVDKHGVPALSNNTISALNEPRYEAKLVNVIVVGHGKDGSAR